MGLSFREARRPCLTCVNGATASRLPAKWIRIDVFPAHVRRSGCDLDDPSRAVQSRRATRFSNVKLTP
jgi:hypothetical protein